MTVTIDRDTQEIRTETETVWPTGTEWAILVALLDAYPGWTSESKLKDVSGTLRPRWHLTQMRRKLPGFQTVARLGFGWRLGAEFVQMLK